jgi:hypothetical protein
VVTVAWISSQNGKILLDASMVYVGEPFKGRCELSACIGSNWDKDARIMGKFPTENRAMEELDSITEWIRSGAEGVFQIDILE